MVTVMLVTSLCLWLFLDVENKKSVFVCWWHSDRSPTSESRIWWIIYVGSPKMVDPGKSWSLRYSLTVWAILETVALIFELISSEFIFIGRTRFRLNLGSLGSILFATFKIKNYNADCSFFYIFTSWHRNEFKIMFLIIIIYTWRYSWWFKLSFKMTLLF